MNLKRHLLIIFLTICYVGQSQHNGDKLIMDDAPMQKKAIDQSQLDQYKQNKAFVYEVVVRKPNAIEKLWNWFIRGLSRALSWIFGNEQAGWIISVLLKILPYLILGILLFLIVKFFLKLDSRQLMTGNIKKPRIYIEDEEALLNSKDLEKLLAEAISQKEYRLAVRYYYLIILKELSKKEHIDWHREKTNEDYIKELKKRALKEKFRASTYLYDFVWYGNFELDEIQFEKAANSFQDLKRSIV